MIRFYLCPMETIVDGRGRNVRQVKYIGALGLAQTSVNDYGNEPLCFLGADVTSEQHAALTANADVVAFPVNLDAQVGANVDTVRAELEARNLPSDNVSPNTYYRVLIRWIVAVFSITTAQPLFSGGVTMDTTLGALTATQRAELKANAESAGYSTAGLTLQSTIREALMKAVQSYARRLTILGVTI